MRKRNGIVKSRYSAAESFKRRMRNKWIKAGAMTAPAPHSAEASRDERTERFGIAVPAFRAIAPDSVDERQFRNACSILPFSQFFSDEDIAFLATQFRKLEVRKGSIMLSTGARAHNFFIVARGGVESLISRRFAENIPVSRYGPGEFFGEASLISQNPEVVDFVAVEDSDLFILGEMKFFRHLFLNRDIECYLRQSIEDQADRVNEAIIAASRPGELQQLEYHDFPLLESTLNRLEFSPSFSAVHRERFRHYFKKIVVNRGTRIMGTGKISKGFVLIGKGAVSVKALNEQGQSVEQARLREGSFFGEEGLLLDRKRAVSFVAAEDCTLFFLSGKDFHRHFCINAEIVDLLRAKGEFRLDNGYDESRFAMAEPWIDKELGDLSMKYYSLFDEAIEKFEYSRHLTGNEKVSLRSVFRILYTRRGKTISRYGFKGNYFFLLARGKVDMKKFSYDGREVTVREFLPGDCFGEKALIRDAPREATYVASEDSLLFCLRKVDFFNTLLSNRLIAQFLTRKAEAKSHVSPQAEKGMGGRTYLETLTTNKVILLPDQEKAMNMLRQTHLVAHMQKSNLEELVIRLIPVRYAPGTVISFDGDRPVYFVSSGSVVVTDCGQMCATKKVQTLRCGSFFGHNELLEKNPFNRRYIASGTTLLFRLSEHDALSLANRDLAINFFLHREAQILNARWRKVFPEFRENRIFLRSGSAAAGPVSTASLSVRSLSSLWLFCSILFSLSSHFLQNYIINLKENLGRLEYEAMAAGAAFLKPLSKPFAAILEDISNPARLKCSEMSLVVFSRQMEILLKAGVGMKRILAVMIAQTLDKNLNTALKAIESDVVYKGFRISYSMRSFPGIFNDLYTGFIRAGEESGQTADAFGQVFFLLERDLNLKKKIYAALTYPLFVLGICMSFVIGIVIFIVPTFSNLFKEMNMTLPLLTRIMIGMVDAIRNPVNDLVILAGAAFFAYLFWNYYRSVQGRHTIDTLLLYNVLAGDLLRKVILTRFCWTLACQIRAGISLIESLNTSEKSIGNVCMREKIEECREKVLKGRSLSQAFSHVDVVPRIFTQLLLIGEETGNLADPLKRAGDLFDRDIQISLETMTKLFEPLMIMVMGILAALCMLSIFVPIYQLMQGF